MQAKSISVFVKKNVLSPPRRKRQPKATAQLRGKKTCSFVKQSTHERLKVPGGVRALVGRVGVLYIRIRAVTTTSTHRTTGREKKQEIYGRRTQRTGRSRHTHSKRHSPPQHTRLRVTSTEWIFLFGTQKHEYTTTKKTKRQSYEGSKRKERQRNMYRYFSSPRPLDTLVLFLVTPLHVVASVKPLVSKLLD